MLEKLLTEAFEKIGHEKGNDTENGRAKYLEDTLRDDFRTSISAKSLVRYLHGESKPKFAIRNALAHYLKYRSYEHFVTEHSEELRGSPTPVPDANSNGLTHAAVASPIPKKNPYKGLSSFEVEDGDYFFGRNAEVETCLKKITTGEGNFFISIIGDSGIGKSSFVQAGILYALKHKKELGFSGYTRIKVRPGKEPFTNLNYQLRLKGIAGEDLVSSNRKAIHLILFFDQFEEVITQCHSAESIFERNKLFEFLDALAVNKNPASKIVIITTFRSDFLSQMANFEVVKKGESVFLSNLDYKLHPGNWESSMAEIIRAPAEKNGVEVSETFLTQLLQELQDVQGSLPILQLALSKIWNTESIRDGRIDASDYIRISGGKGISGILETHAEKVVAQVTSNRMDTERLAILKSIFVNLVEVNENGRDVKKTLTKEELFKKIKFADRHKVEAVFEDMVNQKSRLLTIAEGNDKTIQVNIVHEVLIRRWERLRGWLDEDWEFLLWKKRLNNARDYWEYSGGDKTNLLKEGALHEAKSWLERQDDKIDNEEHIFITESIKSAGHRRRKRWAIISGAMVFITMVGLIMTILYFNADYEKIRARANYLISEAKTLVDEDPSLALRLAEKAMEMQPNDPAILKDARTIYGENNFYNIDFRHSRGVTSAAFSPDENMVLTASDDKTARLWDLQGNPIGKPMEHSDLVWTAEFSPGGTSVVTGSRDGTARFWDLNGNPVGRPMRHEDAIRSATFSPDGSLVLTASDDGTARLWDLSGEPIGVPMEHSDLVGTATFSPDGSTVLTASRDNTARLWDLKGNPTAEPIRHSVWVRSAVFSPDGNIVLTTSSDKTARMWDTRGNPIGIPMVHSDVVKSGIFSPDGTTVLTASWDRTARLWDLTGNPIGVPMEHSGIVNSATFSADGRIVITASRDKTSRLWDGNGNPIGPQMKHAGSVWSAELSRDGNAVLTSSAEGTARLWNFKENPIKVPMEHSGPVDSAIFSPDGNTVLTASTDHTARLWDLKGNPIGVPIEHAAPVSTAIFSPDGATVLTSSWDHTARLWDLLGNPIGIPMEHSDVVHSAVFSPDGSVLLTASRNKTARLWDLDGNPMGAAMEHAKMVTTAVFSPDGTILVTASDDRTARLWNLRGEPLGAPMMHSDWVRWVTFSPDGDILLTACFDGSVYLWDLHGSRVGVPMKHSLWVRSAEFSPDGSTVLTASSDGTARLWDLKGNPKGPGMRHSDAIRFATFSPDGTSVLTCSSDGTARLWDLDGNPIGGSMKHSSLVNYGAFSPDGKMVLTASRDHTARLWNVPVPLEEFLNNEMIQPLSEEQKEKYNME